jgi:hypothetical protein
MQAQQDLAIRVQLAGRDESESGVEATRPIVARYVTGEQLGAAMGAHELHDLLHDLAAVAFPLEPLVDEQLPEEPGGR